MFLLVDAKNGEGAGQITYCATICASLRIPLMEPKHPPPPPHAILLTYCSEKSDAAATCGNGVGGEGGYAARVFDSRRLHAHTASPHPHSITMNFHHRPPYIRIYSNLRCMPHAHFKFALCDRLRSPARPPLLHQLANNI